MEFGEYWPIDFNILVILHRIIVFVHANWRTKMIFLSSEIPIITPLWSHRPPTFVHQFKENVEKSSGANAGFVNRMPANVKYNEPTLRTSGKKSCYSWGFPWALLHCKDAISGCWQFENVEQWQHGGCWNTPCWHNRGPKMLQPWWNTLLQECSETQVDSRK